MHLTLILLVFVVIFISELPDKSLLSSLILSSKYPARYVWLGAASAFLIHVVIAVSIGKALSLLPHQILEVVVSVLFLIGAIVLLVGEHGSKKDTEDELLHTAKNFSSWRIYITAFGITFLSEWGDITQITTASYAARYHQPIAVGIGAVLALWTVTALAVTLGSKAVNFISPKILQRVSALVLLCFAVVSAYSAIK